ncbi:hypothetical protein FRC04_003020 [Tulasnella sp. 424]|nr:hypothetical protein FRC04_003020 [Tulasnella sp. 424]KAG8981182.1 hypothetical protein FRC05_004083 [Tulasnella sp. 425]
MASRTHHISTAIPSINSILPPEVLISVFDVIYFDTVASIHDLSPSHRPPLNRHPLTEVMSVCQLWRQLVEETPSLWTHVVIGTGAGGRELGTNAAVRGEPGIARLRRVLARSGCLPLAVTVAPEQTDFRLVAECLGDEAYRLRTLDFILTDDVPRRTCYSSHFEDLLLRSFPVLERLHLDDLLISTYPFGLPFQISVDAPVLRTLSCAYHIILPESPSLLTSLSIAAVDIDSFDSPLTQGCIQFPELLDLHLSVNNASQFLSAFSTPKLQKLSVLEETPSTSQRVPLPQYPRLEELQWSNKEHDPSFMNLLSHCPNLIRYANYLVGEERSVDFGLLDSQAAIINLAKNKADKQKPCMNGWPNLEEVRLAVATCEDIVALTEGMPSIKRVRILRDPRESGEDEDRQRVAQLLPTLAEKVDIAFWMDPWGSLEL